MRNIDFNKSLRELNGRYKEIFGYIPCIKDYVCTREEYVKAMEKAVDTNKILSRYLVEQDK